MSSITPKIVDTVKTYLMAPVADMEAARVPQQVQKRVLRLREYYSRWLENPVWTDSDVVHLLRNEHGVGTSQAYEDVKLIKICLGEINRHSRDYDRYLFRQRCEEGWRWARATGDLKAFNAVTANYSRGCQLDKDELQAPDYSVITPQTFVISADPGDAGFKRVPGIMEKARKLYAQYAQEAEAADEPENTESL